MHYFWYYTIKRSTIYVNTKTMKKWIKAETWVLRFFHQVSDWDEKLQDEFLFSYLIRMNYCKKTKKKWENACWRIHAGVPFTGKQKNNISKRTIYIYTHVLKYEYVKQQKMIEIIIYNGCDSETICILTAPIHIIMLLLWCNLITTNFKPKLQ
jgi:hypothetical protein